MDDQEFLDRASVYIADESIFAAHRVVSDGLGVEKACADHGGRPKVVEALRGRLKRAVVKNGRVTSALDYVDPFVETAVYDPDDLEVVAAFAIYRTLERPPGVALLIERGTPVQ